MPCLMETAVPDMVGRGILCDLVLLEDGRVVAMGDDN